MADNIDDANDRIRELEEEVSKLSGAQRRGKQSNDSWLDGIENSTNATRAFGSSLTMANTNLLSVAKTLASELNPKSILDKTAQIEFLSSKLVRDSMGASRVAGDAFMTTLVNATTESLKYGVTLEDNITMMKSINDVMQVNTFLTKEQVTDMGVLARNAGVSGGEIASIAKGFADIGVGTNDAIEKMGEMTKMARGYGLNVGQFMKTVGSNMKLLSTYNFKNGIEGFSKMLAKAQALRIDVSSTFALSEKLLDPEQAIETAAGFQMLGGAIGDLGDPFKLLNMAQTDVGGLQDAMLGMAESAVIFDEETGEFDIPVAEMYRLREAAKLAGKSYEEFTQDAIKAKQRTEKLEIFESFGRFDDKTKEMLASFSQFDGGELKVAIPALDEQGNAINKMVSASELTSDDLIKLREKQAEDGVSEREIAMRSMRALESMDAANREAEMVGVKVGVNTKGITDALEAFEAAGKSTTKVVTETFSDENLKTLGGKFTDAIAGGFANETLNQALTEEFTNIGHKFNTSLLSAMDELPDLLEEGNIFKEEGLIRTFIANIDNIGTSFTELESILAQSSLLNTALTSGEDDPNYDDPNLTKSQRDGVTASQSQMDMLSGDGSVTGNDVLLRPDKPDIFLNEDDMTLIAGTDLFGNKQNSMNSPNLGESMVQRLSGLFSRGDKEERGGKINNGKVEVEFKQGLPIMLDGSMINQLSPEDLRKIFGSQEFISALTENLSKNTRYDESILSN